MTEPDHPRFDNDDVHEVHCAVRRTLDDYPGAMAVVRSGSRTTNAWPGTSTTVDSPFPRHRRLARLNLRIRSRMIPLCWLGCCQSAAGAARERLHTVPEASGGRRLQLLMVAHAFPPTVGGVESHLLDIATELRNRGHDVACLVGGTDHDETVDGITVFRRTALTPASLLRCHDIPALQQRLRAVIDAVNSAVSPHIIHAHNGHHYGTALADQLTASHLPAAVNTVHDPVFEAASQGALSAPWALTIYVSEFMRQELPTNSASLVLRLGIDVDAFASATEPHAEMAMLERPVIFHPARLLSWKGVLVGVRAFAKMRRIVGRGSLVLCGSEDIVTERREQRQFRAEVRRVTAAMSVDAHVHWLSFERREIAKAYRASDLVWYPSTGDEPLGLVPLEAMAAGVPVVVSDSGGLVETVVDGTTGLVVARGDEQALCDAATRVLNDKKLRRSLIAAGRHRVDSFRIDDYVDELVGIYRLVGAESRAGRSHV